MNEWKNKGNPIGMILIKRLSSKENPTRTQSKKVRKNKGNPTRVK